MKFEVVVIDDEVVIRDAFDKLVHSRHPDLAEARKSLTVDIAAARQAYEAAQDMADDAKEFYIALLHAASAVCAQEPWQG